MYIVQWYNHLKSTFIVLSFTLYCARVKGQQLLKVVHLAAMNFQQKKNIFMRNTLKNVIRFYYKWESFENVG